MYNKVRNCFPGGDGADRSADGRRVVNSSELNARPSKAQTRGRGCCQLWLREGVAKGSRLASAVAAARSGVWETASRCAGRVVSLSWFLRWALSIRAGRAGRDSRAGLRDQTLPDTSSMMELRRLSPKQVLAKRLAPDIEALRPAPALKSSYLSNQHAALVPRCVCRQQCPHPFFWPAATRADSAGFAA